MLLAVELLAVLSVGVAMALALAHALELPGKLRLPREYYLAMQKIYYPGFTIGGAAEPLGLLLLLLLLFLVPAGSLAFWLMAGALLALLAMHGVYWVVTHPVNNFWLEGFELKGTGARFFAFVPLRRRRNDAARSWTALRDRWEYSHVLRAVLGVASLLLLAAGLAAEGE